MSDSDFLIFCFRIIALMTALGLGAAIAIVCIATAWQLVKR
jgi:hypothetical protein